LRSFAQSREPDQASQRKALDYKKCGEANAGQGSPY
jgi:hypothetical protein